MKKNIQTCILFVRFLRIFLILLVTILFFSCSTYYEIVLENKNPTSYSFDANSYQVKSAIRNGFGKNQIRELSLYFREDNRYEILNTKQNINDAYLRTFLDYMKSKIYFKESEPLDYIADFHLHLDSLTENKTLVTVFTINPRVITGVKPGIGDNFTLGASNFKTVPPSTIEEYEILLIIGNQLRQKGMPPCNYPDSTSKRNIRHNNFLIK